MYSSTDSERVNGNSNSHFSVYKSLNHYNQVKPGDVNGPKIPCRAYGALGIYCCVLSALRYPPASHLNSQSGHWLHQLHVRATDPNYSGVLRVR